MPGSKYFFRALIRPSFSSWWLSEVLAKEIDFRLFPESILCARVIAIQLTEKAHANRRRAGPPLTHGGCEATPSCHALSVRGCNLRYGRSGRRRRNSSSSCELGSGIQRAGGRGRGGLPQVFCNSWQPPLDEPESRALIQTWKERPGMLGFRFYFGQPHNQTWPMDGTLDWLWSAAAKAGMPVALLAGDWLPLLGQIAARHPALKLMMDHMGALRGAKGDAAFPKMKELTTLARYPNVAVKLTGGHFMRTTPIHSKVFIDTTAQCTTLSALTGSFGAPLSQKGRAPGGDASHIFRRLTGFRTLTRSSSWATPFATGLAGRGDAGIQERVAG